MYLTSPLLDDSRLHSLHHRQTAKASTLVGSGDDQLCLGCTNGWKKVPMSLRLKLRLSFNTYVLLSDTPLYSGGIVT